MTKLRPPPARRELVPRPALVGQLAAGNGHKLTLVAAPAGWGKTTLLAAWQERRDRARPFAWLSVDPADNDPVRFWTYFVESIRMVEPSVGKEALALLRAPGTPLLDTVMPTLINELAPVNDPLVVVLDDYHLIESAEIHETVGFLLDHAPPAMRLVISTRSDPPLPLARMRARGELLEIRADELRFSPEESAAFLNDVLRLGLEHDDVLRLHERTEGWAAGLYLAALSLHGRPDPRTFIADFAGDDRHVVDYLGAEVLRGQPEDVRTFLLRTSILDRLSGPLCDAVTQTPESVATLGKIERANLFLVPLDSKREWYRYHHLFRDLLQLELQHAEPALVPELHRCAAAWCLEAGLASEAVHHTIAAGDVGDAGELIALHWHPFVLQGQNAVVSGWLDALPEDALLGDARLCLAKAWTLFSFGRFEDMSPWLDAAEQAPLPAPFRDGNSSVSSATANARASQLNLLGDNARARTYAQQAAELEADTSPWLSIALVVLANTAFWLGRTDEAVSHLRDTLRLGGEAIPTVVLYALGQLAVVAVEQGDFDRARELAAEAANLAAERGLGEYWMAAMAHVAAGKVAAHHGRTAEAEAEILRGLELARRGSAPPAVAYTLLALANVHRGEGRRSEAAARIREARRIIERAPDPGSVIVRLLEQPERSLRLAPRAAAAAAGAQELTERELSVLRLLPGDLSQREIGAELYVSVNTVKSHSKSLFRKLGASSRAEAVARARKLGLL